MELRIVHLTCSLPLYKQAYFRMWLKARMRMTGWVVGTVSMCWVTSLRYPLCITCARWTSWSLAPPKRLICEYALLQGQQWQLHLYNINKITYNPMPWYWTMTGSSASLWNYIQGPHRDSVRKWWSVLELWRFVCSRAYQLSKRWWISNRAKLGIYHHHNDSILEWYLQQSLDLRTTIQESLDWIMGWTCIQ
jgi:hypothetical protein